MEKEIWKDIKDYEGLYKVSNLGNVMRDGRLLKKIDDGRYFSVRLSKNNKVKSIRIHQLVANEFLEKPVSNFRIEIDHIDDDKYNNNLSNLRFITQRENTIKGIKRKKSSKYTGVVWHKRCNKWMCSYTIQGKTKYKYFDDELEASEYYNKKIEEYYV